MQLHVQIAWFYSYIHKLFRKKELMDFSDGIQLFDEVKVTPQEDDTE